MLETKHSNFGVGLVSSNSEQTKASSLIRRFAPRTDFRTGSRQVRTFSNRMLGENNIRLHRLCVSIFLSLLIGACNGVPLRPPNNSASLPVDTESDHGILWKVQRRSKTPSYLLGTIHTERPWTAPIAEPISSTLSESAIFLMEVLPQNLDSPAIASMQSRIHAKLDGKLYLQAVSEGKRVSGLESIEEQLRVLDALKLPDDECNSEVSFEDSLGHNRPDDEILIAYLSRNLTKILALREKLLARLALCVPGTTAAHLRQQLFSRRNRNMLERMAPFLERGSAFIAVGVGHLPGREGLLALLQRDGYRIISVY